MNKQTPIPSDVPVAGQIIQPTISIGVENVPAALGVSRTATFWLIKQGHLPSFKIGKRRLVRVSDMEKLVDKLASGEIVIDLTGDQDKKAS